MERGKGRGKLCNYILILKNACIYNLSAGEAETRGLLSFIAFFMMSSRLTGDPISKKVGGIPENILKVVLCALHVYTHNLHIHMHIHIHPHTSIFKIKVGVKIISV